MTVDQARRALKLKTDADLAAWMRVTDTAVYHWRNAGTLPPRRIAEVQLYMLRKGKGKVA